MAGVARNYWLTALLLAGLAAGALVLPSAMWACLLAAVLAFAGVVLLQGNRWRTAALVVAALALSHTISGSVRCARATIGPTAAPPSPRINSRRRIQKVISTSRPTEPYRAVSTPRL